MSSGHKLVYKCFLLYGCFLGRKNGKSIVYRRHDDIVEEFLDFEYDWKSEMYRGATNILKKYGVFE